MVATVSCIAWASGGLPPTCSVIVVRNEGAERAVLSLPEASLCTENTSKD